MNHRAGKEHRLAPGARGAGGLAVCLALVLPGLAGSPGEEGAIPAPAPVKAPIIRSGCAGAVSPASCLAERDPAFTLYFPFDDYAVRAWLSPDGNTLLAATLKRLAGPDKADGPALTSIDLKERRVLWRKALGKGVDIGQCVFVGPDLAIVTDLENYIAGLNPVTSEVAWEKTCPGTEHCASFFWADPDRRFLALGGMKKLLLLDPALGKQLAAEESLDDYFHPAFSAGWPGIFPQDLFLVQGGMIRIRRDTPEIAWRTPFPTVSSTKSNAGFWGVFFGALLGAALTGGAPVFVPTASVGGAFSFGRTTPPVLAEQQVFASSLGVVYSFDRETGKLNWAQWLPVSQVDDLRVAGDRVYALGGGLSLTKSFTTLQIAPATAYRNGLYALSRADGQPVQDFRAPFNANLPMKRLTGEEVKKLTPKKFGKQEIRWVRADAEILKTQRDLDLTLPEEQDPEPEEEEPDASIPAGAGPGSQAYSFDYLFGMAVGENRIMVGSSREILLLDRASGALRGKVPLGSVAPLYSLIETGDYAVARGLNGVAVFRLSSGTLLWSRPTEALDRFPLFQDPGHRERLHCPRPDLHAGEELDLFRSALFWIDEARGRIILPEKSGSLVALGLADGALAWRLPIAPGVPVRLALEPDPRALFEFDHNTLRLYRVP